MKIRIKKETYPVEVVREGKPWTFEVDPLTPKQEEYIRMEHTGYTRVQGQVIPVPDFVAMKIATAKAVIKAWPCTDEDDAPIPCTDANKETAWLLNPDLINEVLAKAAEIGAGKAKIKAAEKKT